MFGLRTSARDAAGARRRRSWSKEQKQPIIAEIDVGGAPLSEVARRHGVHTSVLFRWRRDLGSVRVASPHHAGPATAVPAARFVPVMLPPPSAPAGVPTGLGLIEIVLDGGRRVRVGSDVDTVALLRIIEVLEARR